MKDDYHTTLPRCQHSFESSLCPLTFPSTEFEPVFLCYCWRFSEAGLIMGPVGLELAPNWSQPSAFYCLYNSSPVEGLHRKLWNELQQTMWVTTMKANKGHYVRWEKQPVCMGTDHHIWLELMSMWLNALFGHPEGIRNFPWNITDSLSFSVNIVNIFTNTKVDSWDETERMPHDYLKKLKCFE